MKTDDELIKAAQKNIEDYNLPVQIIHNVRDLYDIYYKNRWITLGTASEILVATTAIVVCREVI